MCDIDVGADVPCRAERIAQLGKSPRLLESHVGAVAVRAVIRQVDGRGEASLAQTVRRFGLQCVVGAVSQLHVGLHAVVGHLPRDDVYHASHGVRTVEYGCGPAQYLDALGRGRTVGIGYGVPHKAHILRMAVDEHHHTSRSAAQTTQRHGTRGASRDAVSHNAARGDEQTGDLFRQHGQQGGLHRPFDRLSVDRRDGHRQVADVGTVAGSGDDHLVDGVRALHVERIGSGDLLGRCCHGREAQCQGQIYVFAHCIYIDMFSAGRQRRMLSAAK